VCLQLVRTLLKIVITVLCHKYFKFIKTNSNLRPVINCHNFQNMIFWHIPYFNDALKIMIDQYTYCTCLLRNNLHRLGHIATWILLCRTRLCETLSERVRYIIVIVTKKIISWFMYVLIYMARKHMSRRRNSRTYMYGITIYQFSINSETLNLTDTLRYKHIVYRR